MYRNTFMGKNNWRDASILPEFQTVQANHAMARDGIMERASMVTNDSLIFGVGKVKYGVMPWAVN